MTLNPPGGEGPPHGESRSAAVDKAPLHPRAGSAEAGSERGYQQTAIHANLTTRPFTSKALAAPILVELYSYSETRDMARQIESSRSPRVTALRLPGWSCHPAWLGFIALLVVGAGCTSDDDESSNGSSQACPEGLQDCAGRCVDVSTDASNCGECGVTCTTGQVCQTGQCQCQAGLVDCSGTCVDLQSDGDHCGACGQACTGGEVCSSGTCSTSCAEGETACGSSCVDLDVDLQHCGACHQACGGGQTCTSGVCTCINAGQIVCDGICTDPLTDAGNCGACGTVCGAGETCVDGTCTTAGTGGTSGSGGSGATGSGGASAVSCSTPLADRLTVTPVAVTPAVNVEGEGWSAPPLPVLLATSPDGRAKVAWTDGSNVHVTPLDGADQRAGDDVIVEGSEVRGLVAHDDGSAVLVVRGDAMVFERLNEAGAVQSSLTLVGDNSHEVDGDRWIDSWPHQGRLAWSGSQYAAYFGQTGNHGSAGDHQGDHYSFISPSGTLLDGGWDWGCSHSLDERLAHNGNTFAPICTSDTYPGAGIWFSNRVEISPEPSIDNMGNGTKLGGLVPAADGFWLSFTSPANRDSYDVVLIHVGNDGSPSGRVYLTDTPSVDEEYSHLAAYGENLLAAWSTGTELTLAVVDTAGSVLEGPVVIGAQAGGFDDFAAYPSGDVGWAYAWGDLSNLQVMRVARCE